MKATTKLASILLAITLFAPGCGQEDAVFPDTGPTGSAGVCGDWYPGAEEAAQDTYGMEEGKILPCPVWRSARLDGQDTYINIGDEYLKSSEGVGGPSSIVIVVSAERCTNCSQLILAMVKRKAEFDDAGALMIGMARRDLLGLPEDPDFDLDKAAEVLENEGWPVKTWYVINDAEHYFNTAYDEATPWTVVIDTADMVVESNSNQAFSPNDTGVDQLLEMISGL